MTDRTRTLVLSLLGLLLVGGGVFLLVTRDSGSESTTASAPVALDDFGESRVTVRNPTGDEEWCMLVAATREQRNRGLMGVTDPTLAGHDGMLFRFEGDRQGTFFMRNTPMPLSIAFIAASGDVVSTTDMAPCEDRSGCPSYTSTGPYRLAIEVPQGGLDRLGIKPGATVTDDNRAC